MMFSGSSQSVAAASVHFPQVPSVPPFYWKVPGPEKDYMGDNIRHIRQLNQQVKKTKTGLKATFVPGVTKNPKYEHIPSRLSGILKGEVTVEPRVQVSVPLTRSKSHTSGLSNISRPQQLQPNRLSSSIVRSESTLERQPNSLSKEEALKLKPIWGASAAANARRLSRSSIDLSVKPKPQVHQIRRKQVPIQSESIYNWRIAKEQVSDLELHPPGEARREHQQQQFPNYRDVHHVHRVEYLPCDGICAEETVYVNNEGKEDSARSGGSSARTSRGVNTEETRIIQDPSFKRPIIKPTVRYENNQTQATPSNGKHSEDVRDAWGVQNNVKHMEQRLSTLQVKESINREKVHSCITNKSELEKTLPHAAGVIPNYLKQRQQEWKVEEEAKKEAERNADVPHGHVLLSDSERVETLNTLKANYNALVAELNRIPIRIDTIRVRDQKIKLEEQLTKLEQAMRVFSRPRVYVKMNQS